jgi:hypothetical protein
LPVSEPVVTTLTVSGASGDRLLCSICPATLATLIDRGVCVSTHGPGIRTGDKIIPPLRCTAPPTDAVAM